jgi:two-component system sensor histidine kinase NreB
MLPLSIVAGLLVFAAPPLAYRLVTARQLQIQAETYARQLAGAIQSAAEQQPRLWRYNTAKILWATAPHRLQQDIGSVSVRGCDDEVLFDGQALALGTGATGGPVARAPVLIGSYAVARVHVVLDEARHRSRIGWLALFSGLLGALLGFLLYLVPTRVIRGQALVLDSTVKRLTEAEQSLTRSNQELTRRVREAVGEVKALSRRLIEVQENERQRIARDLHDGVGQAVTALGIELELARSGEYDGALHIAEAQRLTDEILAEIRAAVRALRPPGLEQAGLEQGLRDCLERFELLSGIPASLRIQGDLAAVPESVAILTYRILQEALTNVGRHARAYEVGATAEVKGGELLLTVIDDGRGFAPETAGTGTGLRGIDERVAFAGGRVHIETSPGRGVRLEVAIPIEEEWT